MELYIGDTNRWGDRARITLSVADRRQHMAIFGQTGVGKSTLLKSLIVQDILAGRGCAVLDPHGDLAEELLDYIPPHRINDVVYFDPAELERPAALNPLAKVPPDERHRVAEDVVSVFTAIWELSPEHTPRLLYLLTNTVAALMDMPQGATLLGIPRMLTDEHYRRSVVRHIQNSSVKRFFEEEFEKWPDRLRAEATSAVLNKAALLVTSPNLYLMLGQVTPTVRPEAIIESDKIFIANLSKGRLGETTARLLGAFLVTSFDLAARRRAAIPEAERRDFGLYIDELGSFATDRFESMLSEARKYRLHVTAAAQYLDQLSPAIRSAVFGNCGSLVAFRVGAEDARELGRVLAPWPAETLSGLGRGEIVLRTVESGMIREPFLGKTLPFSEQPFGRHEIVQRQSQRRYTRPRASTEARLVRWIGGI